MNPLNSPLEVGIRVLMVLQEAFPERLDLNQLVLLDHSVLHSADLGGPESLHPPVPVRASELGVKRQSIEAGLEVMIRAHLAHVGVGDRGIEFWAGEAADGFTSRSRPSTVSAQRSRGMGGAALWSPRRTGASCSTVLGGRALV